MNDPQRFRSPYPYVENGLPLDLTPRDQAIYVPAVSVNYAIDAYQKNTNMWHRLPRGVEPRQMDFLDQSNDLYRISHVLFSAGQALRHSRGDLAALQPNIITMRDRQNTRLLLDSGGYQIAMGHSFIDGYRDRLQILRWMEEHGDYGMTLDVPLGGLGTPGFLFSSFQDCLHTTLAHLTFFRANRRESGLKLLNVLQGRTQSELDQWYGAVKVYDFEGWAFGGILKNDFYQLCRRIIRMADENLIQNKNWIHVLGTCELETAVLLTGLQRSIGRYINDTLRVSYDTASPFLNMSYGKAYALPNLDSSRMQMSQKTAPDGAEFVNSPVRWPWPSALGDRMVMGDMCVPKRLGSGSYRDTLSNHFLSHHNLSALCWGIGLANRVFDAEAINRSHTIVPDVGVAIEVIEEVLRTGTESRLNALQYQLTAWSKSLKFTSGDHERDF
jgi:hypothetical protein